MMELDHFAVATPALDKAAAAFADMTGVRPAPGGSHPGKGTRNALVALGPQLYLAIDGPDHAQPLVDNNGAAFVRLDRPVLNACVVRTDDLDAARATLEEAGYDCHEEQLNRFTPQGDEVAWRSLTVNGHGFGCAMPIITQWLTAAHPAAAAPQGCTLERFIVRHGEAGRLNALFGALGLDVTVEAGPAADMQLVVRGPSGLASYSHL